MGRRGPAGEVVDLLDERALRGQCVVTITDYAWERADGELVWSGSTSVFTGDEHLSARRFDEQIAHRHQVLAHRWASITPRPSKRGRRHHVRPRHG